MIRQAFPLPFDDVEVIFEFEPRTKVLRYEIERPPYLGTRERVNRFVAAYGEARRQFLEIVSSTTGLTLAVVDELPDGTEAISEPISPASRQ